VWEKGVEGHKERESEDQGGERRTEKGDRR